MKHLVCFSLLFAFIFFFVSCKKEAADDRWSDTINSGWIRIACDENFKPLMDAEIDVFEAHFRGAIVTLVYTSEQEAIRLLLADSVRFALTTRDLTDQERAKLTQKNRQATKHLIAFDGIALIANPANTDSILSLSALKKILSGSITRWSQLHSNATTAVDDTIRVLFDGKESGALRYLVDSVSDGKSFSPHLYALSNALEVIEKVSQMRNAIGVIGVNLISDDTGSTYRNYRDKIRLIRLGKEDIATRENSYLPYAGEIRQENYPLWRSVYVLLSDPRSGLSSGLSIFLANEIGQKIVLKSGLLPITDSQNLSVNMINEYPK